MKKQWTPPPPLPPSDSEIADLVKIANKFSGLKPYDGAQRVRAALECNDIKNSWK